MSKTVNKASKKIRTVYDGEHVKVLAEKGGPSLTKQQFLEDSDINNILARFKKTGQIDPEVLRQNPISGDFSEIADYQTALDTVHHAEALFAALPSQVRERFRNDPAGFVEYATNEKNRAELEQLGLVEKPVTADPGTSTTVPKKDPPPPAGTPAGGGGSQQAP